LTAITGAGFILGLLLLSAALYVYSTIAPDLPAIEGLKDVRLEQPMRVFSADGRLMAEFGVQLREPVSYADTPERLVKAFLAAEDSRFFEHRGIDPQAFVRAARSYLRTGKPLQGGSTITMQVARNFFLTREKTLRRKFAEIILALRIERELSKPEILELYQNKIFFGHRAYGVSAAAKRYYDKALEDLSLAQTAMLAGIPQAPSSNNPITDPEEARQRRDYVLRRMYELGFVDEPAFRQALNEPESARLHQTPIELDAPYAAEMVRAELVARFGKNAYRDGLSVLTSIDSRLQRLAEQALRQALGDYDERHGYRGPEARVPDPDAADGAELDRLLGSRPLTEWLTPAIVVAVSRDQAELYLAGGQKVVLGLPGVTWARRHKSADRRGAVPRRLTEVLAVGDLIRVRKGENDDWRLAQLPAVEGALVILAPEDGAILALVGGLGFALSKFNRAVDARRQPGSSFKPFIYAAALEQGWTPASLLDDEPIAIRDGSGELWRPKNFDRKYLGPVRLRQALAKSRNLASINLLRGVGVEFVRDYVGRFGFAREQLPRGLSLALGTAEVSPLDMAGAYAVFANGGYRVEPYLVRRIDSASGAPLFRANPPRACGTCWYQAGSDDAVVSALGTEQVAAERVLDARLAFQVDSLLRDVIRVGTGHRAKALERTDLAGKTGTTNDVHDSWFCGYQKDLVAVAWMGFDNPRSLGRKETGGRAALSMWMEFMGPALEGKLNVLPTEPPGLVHLAINRYSGNVTVPEDPDAIFETVREEYELMLLGPGGADYYWDIVEDYSTGGTERVLDDLF
jgi:penicillin-binding protein 1A